MCLWADVGTAFAFSYKYLFTAFHVLHEPDPEFEVEGIYISEPLNPMKFLYELEVVGMARELDVAVLRCRKVHFFRLRLRCTALQAFSSVYTTQRIESVVARVHRGHAYQGDTLWEGRCDAPSTDGRSGGPVLDSRGLVVGMLKGRKGDIDGVFIISEGLMHALSIIKGPSMAYKDWGLVRSASSSLDLASPKHEGVGGDFPFRKRQARHATEPGRDQER
jgi:hypothetical protein